jgi:cell division protease FtsH
MAAGYTITLPDNDDNHVTKNKLMDTITMMLAGRVAEELVIKDISTGASNDIQRASSIARKMVTEWGMSPIGTIYLVNDHEVFLGSDFGTSHSYSENMAGKVDGEVSVILNECYKRASEILTENRALLDAMVRLLFERSTIFADEVDMLYNGKSAEEILAAMDAKEKAEAEERAKAKSKVSDLIVKEKFVSPEGELQDSAYDNND